MPQGNLLQILQRAEDRKSPLLAILTHSLAIVVQITLGTATGLSLGAGFARAMGAI